MKKSDYLSKKYSLNLSFEEINDLATLLYFVDCSEISPRLYNSLLELRKSADTLVSMAHDDFMRNLSI